MQRELCTVQQALCVRGPSTAMTLWQNSVAQGALQEAVYGRESSTAISQRKNSYQYESKRVEQQALSGKEFSTAITMWN